MSFKIFHNRNHPNILTFSATWNPVLWWLQICVLVQWVASSSGQRAAWHCSILSHGWQWSGRSAASYHVFPCFTDWMSANPPAVDILVHRFINDTLDGAGAQRNPLTLWSLGTVGQHSRCNWDLECIDSNDWWPVSDLYWAWRKQLPV